MKLKIILKEFEFQKFPYGLAYRKWESGIGGLRICYPVPLNLFVAFGRWLWFIFSYRLTAYNGYFRKALNKEYQKGYDDGWQEGMENASNL